MADEAAIEHVAQQLSQATSFVAIFGDLSGGATPADKKRMLRSAFGKLAFMVHPDHAPPGSAKHAHSTFERLNELRRNAETAIEDGTYAKPFGSTSGASTSSAGDHFEVQSATASYRLSSVAYRRGDLSVLYKGRRVNDNIAVMAKIAAGPTFNGWLEREAQVLTKFSTAKAGDPLVGLRPTVPELLDTFLIDGGAGKRFRVNMTRFIPDLVSITDIINAHSRGLDPQEAAWVIRRIIAQPLAARMAGVVHGAMTPDHVLVDPIKHEPLHIGWAHAVDAPWKTSLRIMYVIDRWRSFYPPEVFAKEVPSLQTDLYMAGKMAIKLLGGDEKRNTLPKLVPAAMARLVLAMVEKSPARRPQDGVQLLDEFTRVVRGEWGRRYRPLSMPVSS